MQEREITKHERKALNGMNAAYSLVEEGDVSGALEALENVAEHLRTVEAGWECIDAEIDWRMEMETY